MGTLFVVLGLKLALRPSQTEEELDGFRWPLAIALVTMGLLAAAGVINRA